MPEVTELRASDGAPLGTFPVGGSPAAITFDGANIWTADAGTATATKLRASDGVHLGTFPVGNFPTASPTMGPISGYQIRTTTLSPNCAPAMALCWVSFRPALLPGRSPSTAPFFGSAAATASTSTSCARAMASLSETCEQAELNIMALLSMAAECGLAVYLKHRHRPPRSRWCYSEGISRSEVVRGA